jgi:hypothetical protein
MKRGIAPYRVGDTRIVMEQFETQIAMVGVRAGLALFILKMGLVLGKILGLI